jgi:hypothetical protein
MIKPSRWFLGFDVRGFYEEVGSIMKARIAVGASVALALLVGSVMAADAFQSGPQVGSNVPGPFHPLNVTGANAGQKACQV